MQKFANFGRFGNWIMLLATDIFIRVENNLLSKSKKKSHPQALTDVWKVNVHTKCKG